MNFTKTLLLIELSILKLFNQTVEQQINSFIKKESERYPDLVQELPTLLRNSATYKISEHDSVIGNVNTFLQTRKREEYVDFLKKQLELFSQVYFFARAQIYPLVGIQPITAPVASIFRTTFTNNVLDFSSHPTLAESWKIKIGNVHQKVFEQFKDIDIKSEILSIQKELLVAGMVDEVYRKIENLANFKQTLNNYNVDNIVKSIISISNDIAKETRRGKGNVVACNDLSLVQKLINHPDLHNHKIVKITLSDPCPKIIVGYKGTANESECGIVYSPYMIIQNQVIDGESFEPVTHTIVRRGVKEFDDSGKYYGVINFDF